MWSVCVHLCAYACAGAGAGARACVCAHARMFMFKNTTNTRRFQSDHHDMSSSPHHASFPSGLTVMQTRSRGRVPIKGEDIRFLISHSWWAIFSVFGFGDARHC